tara:strand:- start:452 stop:1810 length:1359 start_codon:yes stop_codon:yes gene_type:complete
MNIKIIDKNAIPHIVILIFITIEVLFYGPSNSGQITLASLSYLTIFLFLLVNFQRGIFFYLIFSILSISSWSYPEFTGYNFLGLRIFDISVNSLFGGILVVFILIREKKIQINKYVIIIITFLSLYGLYNVYNSTNYLNNYIGDIKSYILILIYIVLIKCINKEYRYKLIYFSIIYTLIQLIISYIFNIRFSYDINSQYILMNSFSYILPFTMLFSYKYIGKINYIIFTSILAFFILSGNFFIGGKFIFIAFLVLFWAIYHKSKILFISSVVLFLVFVSSINEILLILQDYFSGTVTANRLAQIQFLIETLDITEVAETRTSLGNVIAEVYTVFTYFKDNLIALLIGLGFGGGVPDVHNYLGQYAGAGGYSEIDQFRDNYFRMHLPITEIFLKMGLIGVSIYFYFIKEYLSNYNMKSISILILVLFVFYISKEMLLLTIVFFYFPINRKYDN